MSNTEALATVLAIGREGIRIRDIATMDLWTVDPLMPACEVHAQMVAMGFDTAPLDDQPIWRFVSIDELEPDERPVNEVARAMRADDLAHESLGLLTALEALRTHPFLFVLKDREVTGVVSRSDVQRTAAAIAALSLILAAEQGLRELIRINDRDDWMSRLKPDRREQVRSIYESRQREDAVIDEIECLPLADTFDLIAKYPAVLDLLGTSRTQLQKLKKRLNSTRDTLAHAGSLLTAVPDPIEAIERFHEIKTFAETVWAAVGQSRSLTGGTT